LRRRRRKSRKIKRKNKVGGLSRRYEDKSAISWGYILVEVFIKKSV
jgi:hypothetical protein